MCNVRLAGQGILSLAGKCGPDHAYKYTENNLPELKITVVWHIASYTAIVAQYTVLAEENIGKFGDSPNLPFKLMMFAIKIANKQEFAKVSLAKSSD